MDVGLLKFLCLFCLCGVMIGDDVSWCLDVYEFSLRMVCMFL